MNNTQNTYPNEIIELVKFFNSETSFEKVVSLSSWDEESLKSSLKIYGAELIKSAFLRANKSRFLTGNKGYEWKAGFGWIVDPNHIGNILSGKYDDYKRAEKPVSKATDSQFSASTLPESQFSAPALCDSSLSDADEFVSAALARGFDDMFNEK